MAIDKEKLIEGVPVWTAEDFMKYACLPNQPVNKQTIQQGLHLINALSSEGKNPCAGKKSSSQ
jgi:hypothetical protein